MKISMRNHMRRSLRLTCVATFLAVTATSMGAVTEHAPVHAQGTSKGASGLPLPRFVSLKSRRVNIRIGPSTDYAVSWMYMKEGLPMEIIQEYENWRRVRDADGTEGWVNQALLSGERTAVAAPWMKGKGKDVFVNMRREAQNTSSILAKLEPGVIMRIKECNGTWCRAEAGSVEGWVSQGEIWGAYPGEAFK
jgi:SH3-like domain-containing protein